MSLKQIFLLKTPTPICQITETECARQTRKCENAVSIVIPQKRKLHRERTYACHDITEKIMSSKTFLLHAPSVTYVTFVSLRGDWGEVLT